MLDGSGFLHAFNILLPAEEPRTYTVKDNLLHSKQEELSFGDYDQFGTCDGGQGTSSISYSASQSFLKH